MVSAEGVAETGHNLVQDQQGTVLVHQRLQSPVVFGREEVDLGGKDHRGDALDAGQFLKQVQVVAELHAVLVPPGQPHRWPVL